MDGEIRIQKIDARSDYLANGKIWFHAVHHDEVVGMIAVEREDQDFIWLNDLYVLPCMRRLGVATRLITEAEKLANRGVAVGINKHNDDSLRLFASLGYRYVYDYSEDNTQMFSKQVVVIETKKCQPPTTSIFPPRNFKTPTQ